MTFDDFAVAAFYVFLTTFWLLVAFMVGCLSLSFCIRYWKGKKENV
ncbi:hypothetical protein SAMN04487969_1551 [Paenibacillus algorifonticola]|uniref:Uncharacterized protein n=1 Tax=Paenibacillus algorifonticola TaxID=684063 RepID=A0A1I2J7X0_9BACL|nr:hypothetical protein [Paenibacillus algorifonticola]SFF49307.1 hypothetical protein SAMN04487969_1551 [Paenibacillus algorifonticola]